MRTVGRGAQIHRVNGRENLHFTRDGLVLVGRAAWHRFSVCLPRRFDTRNHVIVADRRGLINAARLVTQFAAAVATEKKTRDHYPRPTG